MSSTWDGQDQHMATGGDDDFHQFLDMSGMGNMADTMQFDFQTFQDGSNQHLMGQASGPQPRQHADTIMGNADVSNMVPRSDGLLQNHTPAIAANTPNHTAMSSATHMLATSAPSESITNIDAQIQYLQQQKFHQQQRQIQEQQAAFFTAHNTRSVPPTPQSLEMPPGSGQFYSQAEPVSQRTAYDRGYHHRNAEQQDVRILERERERDNTNFLGNLTNQLFLRWLLRRLFLPQSPLSILTSTWKTPLLSLDRILVP